MAQKNKKKKSTSPEEWKKQKPINANSKAATATQSKAKSTKKGKDGKPAKPSLWQRLKAYFKGVKVEIQRVVWPTRPELVSASLIVVAALVFFGVLIAIVDNVIIIPLDWVGSIGS